MEESVESVGYKKINVNVLTKVSFNELAFFYFRNLMQAVTKEAIIQPRLLHFTEK